MSTPAKITPSKLCKNIAQDIINLFLDETNVRLSFSHREVLLGAIQSIISQQLLKNSYSLLPDSQLHQISAERNKFFQDLTHEQRAHRETAEKLKSLQTSFRIPKI